MHRPRFTRSLLRTALVLLACAAAASLGAASTLAAPLRSVPGNSVLLRGGSSATLTVKGIALQPASSIAEGEMTIASQPLAPERVRTTLFYAIDWGYAESAPQQAALAVWYAQSGTWAEQDRAAAERIANAAAASPGSPSWSSAGRSVLSYLPAQISVSELRLTPLPGASAVGQGRLTLTNTGSQDLLVYLPYGTVFTGASGSVIAWATGIDEQMEPQVEPAATETQAPPAPPEASPTATVDYKTGTTPAAEPTGSYKVVRPSPTSELPVLPPAEVPPQAEEPVLETSSESGAQTAVDTAPASPADPALIAEAAPAIDSSVRARPQPPAAKPEGGDSPKNVEPQAAGPTGAEVAAEEAPAEPEVSRPAVNAPPPPDIPRAQATVLSQVTIPAPESTEEAGGGESDKLPLPVATGGTTDPADLPGAQETANAPISTVPSSTSPTRQPASQPTNTPTPEPTTEEAQVAEVDGQASTDGKPVTTDGAPVAQPAPVPPGGPVINVESSDSSPAQKGATPSQAPISQAPIAGAPASAPATGGGPSTAGLWLAGGALLLVVVGLRMRRSAGALTSQ